MAQATSTTTVPWITWFWVGHSTFLSSAQHSPMKPKTPTGAALTSPAGRASSAGMPARHQPRVPC